MHFQEMAADKDMWNVTTKDEAILWLWRAHNIVSDRISGDVTEDPMFPKIKFPSSAVCPKCRPGFNFSEDEVLIFLKKMHANENINSFGTKSIEEIATPQSLIHFYKNEHESNILSENFSSIAVIGFCVCICILFTVALMFVPRKKSVARRVKNFSNV